MSHSCVAIPLGFRTLRPIIRILIAWNRRFRARAAQLLVIFKFLVRACVFFSVRLLALVVLLVFDRK